jgi:uncharacterized protein (TIGR00255 family)
MNSMTGYGRGLCARDGYQVEIELSSVNRRQLEIVIAAPSEMEPLESRVREELAKSLARGRVSVRISLELGEMQLSRRVRINAKLAKAFARELAELAQAVGLPSQLSLDALLRIPGVIENHAGTMDSDKVWPVVQQALQQALARLGQMRAREGRHLAKELRQQVATMRRLVRQVQGFAPAVVANHREQLVARLQKAGLPGIATDDERLVKEVVLFADRADISEELTRLGSHFGQFQESLTAGEPTGRTLDFLAQEMNREVNTIGSKANDARISKAVVLLKTEIEKFREQVQNIE